MTQYLVIGTILGLSAGFTPGPLLALVVSETLRHGNRAGLKVALVPLFTDAPIIALTLLVLSQLSQFHGILGAISLLGGCLVCYLGYDLLVSHGSANIEPHAESRSFRKGLLVNVLSPHPYLFWFSVGTPTVLKAHRQSMGAAVAFVAIFYVMLVGSLLFWATMTNRSRALLSGKYFCHAMRALGVLLCLFGMFLFYDGFRLLMR